jgi:putative ABC transport system permease protein
VSGIGPVRLALRGLRPAAGISALIALLVLVGAFLAAGAPRQTTAVLTSALQAQLARTAGPDAIQTTLTDDAVGDPVDGIAPVWSGLGARLADVHERLADLGPIARPGEFAGTSTGTGHGFGGSGTPTTPTGFTPSYALEATPSLAQEARLVAGRWPAPEVAGQPLEVVMSAVGADVEGWRIGQTQTISGGYDHAGIPVTLVGTVAPRDPTTAFWGLAYTRGGVVTIQSNGGDSITKEATIWVDAGSWPALAATLPNGAISAWYGLDHRAIASDRAADVSAAVRRFVVRPEALGIGSSQQQLAFRSRMPADLADFATRSGPPTALIALFALGPAGTLAAVLLLGLRLRRARRSAPGELMRARGASGGQLRLLAAAEIAVWTVPAAAIGTVAAVLLTPDSRSVWSAVATAALCAVVAPIAAVVTSGSGERTAPRSPAARAAGVAAEAAALLVAALALVVLVARGPVTASTGVDPLVELAPLLLSIAVTVLVLRIMPLGVRAIGAAQGRGRGAVGLVASSGTGFARRGGAWALFALVIGVGMSVFSLTMVATQQHGVRQAALATVGSDIAVSGSDLDPDAMRRLEALPAVAAHATVRTTGTTQLGISEATIYLVDTHELAAVQRDLDDSALRAVHGADALVTDIDQPPATTQLDPTGDVRMRLHPADPAAVSDVFTQPRWVVIDRAEAPDSDPDAEIVGVILRLHPGADAAAATRDVQRIAGSAAVVTSAAQVEAEVVGTPLDTAVHATILIATVLAALLCVLVFAMTLAAGAAERLRRGAILRALGFDRRQTAALVLADVVPTAVVGVVAGAVTGVVLAAAVLHTIDPTGFVGAPVAPALVVDPATTAIVLAGFLLAAGVAAIVALLLDLARSATAGLETLGEER